MYHVSRVGSHCSDNRRLRSGCIHGSHYCRQHCCRGSDYRPRLQYKQICLKCIRMNLCSIELTTCVRCMNLNRLVDNVLDCRLPRGGARTGCWSQNCGSFGTWHHSRSSRSCDNRTKSVSAPKLQLVEIETWLKSVTCLWVNGRWMDAEGQQWSRSAAQGLRCGWSARWSLDDAGYQCDPYCAKNNN